jgi:Na+/melibiose symporter-like transporter
MAVNLATRMAGESRLRTRDKWGQFALNLGSTPFGVLTALFLLKFYTDIVGLDPAKVGTMFLVARLFDAFTDPLAGYIIDHLPRTRWGRFYPGTFLWR